MGGIVAGLDGALTPAGARTLLLALDRFSGPLERLLELARDQQIDLARLPLAELVGQVMATMAWDVPLPQRADWLVMEAWLLQLRSRLLLPVDAPARQAADGAADRLRHHLLGLAGIQGAGRVARRPAAARPRRVRPGCPEDPRGAAPRQARARRGRVPVGLRRPVRRRPAKPDTAERYIPATRVKLHSVSDAIARILRRLADAPDGRTLDQLLPEVAPSDATIPAGSPPLGGEGTPSPQAALR